MSQIPDWPRSLVPALQVSCLKSWLIIIWAWLILFCLTEAPAINWWAKRVCKEWIQGRSLKRAVSLVVGKGHPWTQGLFGKDTWSADNMVFPSRWKVPATEGEQRLASFVYLIYCQSAGLKIPACHDCKYWRITHSLWWMAVKCLLSAGEIRSSPAKNKIGVVLMNL
jgi:hypothetical protein